MQVRAIARGYYAGSLKDVGDVFEAEGKASWFVPAIEDAPEASQASAVRKRQASATAGTASTTQ